MWSSAGRLLFLCVVYCFLALKGCWTRYPYERRGLFGQHEDVLSPFNTGSAWQSPFDSSSFSSSFSGSAWQESSPFDASSSSFSGSAWQSPFDSSSFSPFYSGSAWQEPSPVDTSSSSFPLTVWCKLERPLCCEMCHRINQDPKECTMYCNGKKYQWYPA